MVRGLVGKKVRLNRHVGISAFGVKRARVLVFGSARAPLLLVPTRALRAPLPTGSTAPANGARGCRRASRRVVAIRRLFGGLFGGARLSNRTGLVAVLFRAVQRVFKRGGACLLGRLPSGPGALAGGHWAGWSSPPNPLARVRRFNRSGLGVLALQGCSMRFEPLENQSWQCGVFPRG